MEKRIFLDTNIILDKENLIFDNKERYVISFISFLEILSYEKNTYEYVNYLVKNNIEIIKVSNSLLENKENIELQEEILQNYKEEKFIRKIIENKKVLNLKNSLYRRWITSLIYYFKEIIYVFLANHYGQDIENLKEYKENNQLDFFHIDLNNKKKVTEIINQNIDEYLIVIKNEYGKAFKVIKENLRDKNYKVDFLREMLYNWVKFTSDLKNEYLLTYADEEIFKQLSFFSYGYFLLERKIIDKTSIEKNEIFDSLIASQLNEKDILKTNDKNISRFIESFEDIFKEIKYGGGEKMELTVRKNIEFLYFSSLENYLDLTKMSYSNPKRFSDDTEKILLDDDLAEIVGVRCFKAIEPDTNIEEDIKNFIQIFKRNNKQNNELEIAFYYEMPEAVVLKDKKEKEQYHNIFWNSPFLKENYVYPINYISFKNELNIENLKEDSIKIFKENNFNNEIKKQVIRWSLLIKDMSYRDECEYRIVDFFDTKEMREKGVHIENKKASAVLIFKNPFELIEEKQEYLKKIIIQAIKEKIKIILLNKEVGNKLYDWLRERNIGIDFKNHIENKLVEIMSEKTYVLFELQEN